MTRTRSRHAGRSAWIAGAAVLAALLGTIVWMASTGDRMAARLVRDGSRPQPAAPSAATPLPLVVPSSAAARSVASGVAITGVVRLPAGQVASGASVVVWRASTGWPEWRRERLDEATTGADGTFQFRADDVLGLLLGFEHPRFAGGLVDVRRDGGSHELQLQPGFGLTGVVRNAAGQPLAGARVAVESVPGDDRPVATATSAGDGSYAFANLVAGPVRVVARHAGWQPIAQPGVVIGDQQRVDLQFARPSAAPFRGRVVRAGGGEAIAEALVQLLPLSGKLGLVDADEARTGADGSFEIQGLARGSMRLFVRHPEFGALLMTKVVGRANAVTAAEPDAEPATGLVLELPGRSQVAGLLRGPGLTPAAEGVVLQIRDFAGQIAWARLAADGSFRFATALSPGFARLRALDAPFAFQRSATAEIDVRIDEAVATRLELLVEPPTRAHGRVVDEQGAPIAGASLVRTKLLTDNARKIGDAAALLDLGAIGSQVVQMFAADREQVVATSGPDGAFELLGAKEPGVLRIQARGHGTALVRLESPTQEFGNLVLPRGCRIEGRVLRGMRPLAGATVLVLGNAERAGAAAELLSQAMVVTDGNGMFRVDDVMPGSYRVRARLPSQPAGSVRTVTASPRAPVNVPLLLGAGRRLQGVVTGSDGEPVAGALVAVRGASGMSTVTDERGDFVFDVPERELELEVALVDRRAFATVVVPPRQAQVAVRLATPPACTLTARLAGLPGRRPLAAALLRFVPADGGDGVAMRVLTSDGELRYAGWPTGRGRVEIWSEGHAPLVLPERDFVANETVALGDLLLEPGCRVHGIVRDRAGRPVADAVVLLGEEADLDLLAAVTRSQADGSFRVRGVSHRASRLVAQAPGFAPTVVDLDLPRDLLAGQPLAVTLAAGASIEVTIAPEVLRAGALVQLRRGGRIVASVEPDEFGIATFQNRSPGDYTAVVVGGAPAEKPVVVDAESKRVTVRLP